MRVIFKVPRRIVPLFIAALFFLTLYVSNFPCAARVVFYPLYRELKKESFIDSDKSFYIEESSNFRIYYKYSSLSSIELIKKNAEESLKNVINDFKYQPEGKIDIIVYPEYSEMANKIGLGRGSTAMGVYFGGSISILEPTEWIGKNKNIHEIFTKEGPILHELTHYMLDYKSGGNVPIWFTEGVALYEEYRINRVEWAGSKSYTSYYSIEELEKYFYELDEVKAYRQSFLIIKYIGNNFGMDAIDDIIKELRTGRTIGQAIEKVLNMNQDELFSNSLLE